MPVIKTLDNQQINLYTKGNEFSLEGINYIGEYHIENNIPYTGYDSSYVDKKILSVWYPTMDMYVYDKITNSNYSQYTYPVHVVRRPTQFDYNDGYYYRYFVYKNNDNDGKIYELDIHQYSKYGKKKGIDSGLYGLLVIKWLLTGETNFIYSSNSKEINLNSVNCPGIKQILKDPLQYTL